MAEKIASAYVTSYGYADNDPPGYAIAYPTLHKGAGGRGTYADPITFASDRDDIAPGTRIYVPYLKKYFIMEDYCASAVENKNDGLWVDVWAGGTANSDVQALNRAENAITRESAQIIIDPTADHPVDLTPIFEEGTPGVSPRTPTRDTTDKIVNGTDRSETMNGTNGADIMSGEGGSDTLAGGANNDRLFGRTGDDTLMGGSGHDSLQGGTGSDQLWGGSGDDAFVFTNKMSIARDVIRDFVSGDDHIDLSRIDANAKTHKDDAFFLANDLTGKAGQIHVYNDGKRTFVDGDVDGDARADFHLTILGVHKLHASEFDF